MYNVNNFESSKIVHKSGKYMNIYQGSKNILSQHRMWWSAFVLFIRIGFAWISFMLLKWFVSGKQYFKLTIWQCCTCVLGLQCTHFLFVLGQALQYSINNSLKQIFPSVDITYPLDGSVFQICLNSVLISLVALFSQVWGNYQDCTLV